MRKYVVFTVVCMMLSFMAIHGEALTLGSHVLTDNGYFTSDSVTGLDWLDFSYESNTLPYPLDKLVNRSRQEVDYMLQNDSALAGFRYATEAEAQAFFSSDLMDAFRSDHTDRLAFIALLGDTYSNNPHPNTGALIAHPTVNTYSVAYVGAQSSATDPSSYNIFPVTPLAAVRWSSMGWALVRETVPGNSPGNSPGPVPGSEVPEPGTVLLLGAGLLGMVALRRKYRR